MLLNIFFIVIIELEKIILEIFFGIYFQKTFKKKGGERCGYKKKTS